jgi:MoaA/NifB/PqqE/SkfB family radical SAM enzyme
MRSEAQKSTFSTHTTTSSNAISAATIRSVLNRLIKAPYLCADEIAKKESLSHNELNTIYRIIQSTDSLQNELKISANRDYFDTVKNHFGKQQYTVVFFVGLYCPARCHFCPSVEIHDDGYRELFRFKSKTPGKQKLSYQDFERIFLDLNQMQQQGATVSIKISGGLEPFTDPNTISWILTLAKRFGINSTIFTNGMLLKLQKNRELALLSDNIRISLSTSDEESYNDAYFGSHQANKKVASLHELLTALQNLVKQRDESGAKMQIGINVVAGEFNFHELEKLTNDTASLGVDYIEIKGEYFETKNASWFNALDLALGNITRQLVSGRIGRTRVDLTGSLGRDNFFNNRPKGHCLSEDQAAHKLFINPFGECTPVHYWAYPSGGRQQEANQFLGAVSELTNLFDLIKKANQLPELDYSYLNPFELILSLESNRRRRDFAFGIDPANNPYLSPGSQDIANSIQTGIHEVPAF